MAEASIDPVLQVNVLPFQPFHSGHNLSVIFSSAVIKIEIPCEEVACHHVTKAKTFAFKIRNLLCQEKKQPYIFLLFHPCIQTV